MTSPSMQILSARKKRVFYVDATNGNDSNDGRSPSNAWQTISKVNGESFVPGDTILFRRGETWTGTVLIISDSGKKNAPIWIGAYGSGALPKIDGNDVSNCFYINGQNHIWIKDLDLAQGYDAGLILIDCGYIHVENLKVHDHGNDGLLIDNSHHVDVYGGEYYDGYSRTGTAVVSGIEIMDGSHDVFVVGAITRNQADGGMGITIHSHSGEAMPYNITIRNCISKNNDGHGIQVYKQDDTADGDKNIRIEANVLINNTLEGIRIYKSGGAANYPYGVKVYENYSYGNSRYAYWFEGDNLTIRNNIFRGRGFISACKIMRFWNNTLYFETGAGLYPLYIQNARSEDIDVKNNITFCTTAGGMAVGVATGVTGSEIDIDYNLYHLDAEAITALRWHWLGTSYGWADWLTNSGQDANSPTPADPIFVDASKDDFKLQAGSPAIDKGIDVGLPFVPPNPDLGRWEKGLDY